MTVAFLGDGTLGQGVVYESLNIASLWALPILFVVENNFYAQSTPSRLQLAGRHRGARGAAFGIETARLATTDVAEIERARRPRSSRASARRGGRSSSCSTRTASARTRRATTTATRPRSRRRARRDPLARRRARGSTTPSAPRSRRPCERAASTQAIEERRRGAAGRARLTAMDERCATALNEAPDRGLRAARRRLPPRRGHPRPVRRRVQGHEGPEHALARPRDHDAGQRGVALRRRGRDGAARLPADPRDHVRRLRRARLRPDRQRDREVPRDVRRPGARAARRAHADGRRPRLRADAQPVAREAAARRARDHGRRRRTSATTCAALVCTTRSTTTSRCS